MCPVSSRGLHPMRKLFLFALLLAAPARLLADAPADVDRLNKKIDGVSHAALKDKKTAVVVFLSFDCPVSNSYAPTLAELHKKYGKDVGFLGVIAGSDLTADQIAKQAKE